MKKIFVLFSCVISSMLVYAQQICHPTGNLMVYSNYEGGLINVVVDQNIPNLKIGVCTYDAVEVNFSGPFVGNITGVIYAGFNGSNNTNCGTTIPTTAFSGLPLGVTPVIHGAEQGNIAEATHYGTTDQFINIPLVNCMVGADADPNTGEACVSSNEGGANSSEQIVNYFLSEFGAGTELFAHYTFYECFNNETHTISSGGNCCLETPITDPNPIYQLGGGHNLIQDEVIQLCNGSVTITIDYPILYQPPTYPGYTWSNGITGATATFTTPGMYIVTGGDYCHYTSDTYLTDTIIITPCFELLDTSICAGECVPLQVTGQLANIVDYLWSTGETTPSITVCPATNTTYQLQITDVLGTTYNLSASVTVNAIPTVAISSTDTTICFGDAVTLVGNGATSYLWSNGISNSTITVYPLFDQGYTVIGNSNGCLDTASLFIQVSPLMTETAIITDETCFIGDDGSVTPTVTGGISPYTYVWSNGSTQPTLTNVSAGDYQVLIEDAFGCSIMGNYTIQVPQPPVASFYPSSSDLNELNTEVTFFNTTQESYSSVLWDFGDGATSTNENPTHVYPTNPASYGVAFYFTDLQGCQDTVYYTMIIKESLTMYVPNAFTPDGDEYNNTFKPVLSTAFDPQNYTFKIYNRWGELVFESHDSTIGWDGTYHDYYAPNGIYTWTIVGKSKTTDLKISQTGHVNLMR